MKTIFVDGLKIYPPNAGAPSFVKGSLVVTDVKSLCDFMKKYQDDKGQVRIDINVSKTGKLYTKLNPYGNSRLQPVQEPQEQTEQEKIQAELDSIPF